MNKTEIKVFTIADYEEEEIWLRQQHQKGWKIMKMIPPCFYIFESCEPEDVIYRLDFRNREQSEEYLQMVKDFGWEYVGQCVGWLYFRKKADEAQTAEESELFSDNPSKVEMITKIVKTRIMPLTVLFLTCVAPNFIRFLDGEYIGPWGMVFGIFTAFMFVLYVYILTHCGLKLKMLKKKYEC